MTKIPDDVVELAVKTMAKAPKDNGTVEDFMTQMARAAGEVFVAWEREQCIEIVHRHKSKVEINEPLWHEGQDWACQRIADAIEARSAPEKE